MSSKLLHTPEGVRDIYNSECERKMQLQRSLHKVIKSHGFNDIQTPTFEFEDIFSKERGSVSSRDMYKFVDREGDTLVLRPDITPSIARCIAKYFKDEKMPIRLCYLGSTFINSTSYQGKLKETTQIGAELINDGSIEGEGEILAITIEALLASGLKEFQVEIGHADFFKGLLEEAGFNDEEESELRDLIEEKNIFGVESLIAKKDISTDLKEVFTNISELFGSLDVLTKAKGLTNNESSLNAISHLEQLYEILKIYGLEKYITFDLGMLSKYNYYTGIIFKAYTYGTGDTIANGGRYDNLVGQFGKNAPAVGTAIMVDELILALSRQKLELSLDKNTLLLYEGDLLKQGINLAKYFRSTKVDIELLKKDDRYSLEDYISYGKRMNIGGILYFGTPNIVKIYDVDKGTNTQVNINDLMLGDDK